jgi:hypothetical protein
MERDCQLPGGFRSHGSTAMMALLDCQSTGRFLLVIAVHQERFPSQVLLLDPLTGEARDKYDLGGNVRALNLILGF